MDEDGGKMEGRGTGVTWLWGESGENGKGCVYNRNEVTMVMI